MKRQLGVWVLVCVLSGIVFSQTAFAAAAKKTGTTDAAAKINASGGKKKNQNKWVCKKKVWYYYGPDGKKCKGLCRIGKKKYYFNGKGQQLTGWRKIGKSFYRFRLGGGKTGYMLTNKVIDCIPLRKNGKAVLKKSRLKRKAKVLAAYAEWVDSIVKPGMSYREKMRACYDYLRKERKYIHGPDFRYDDPDWDLYYAEEALQEEVAHDCYPSAAALAYMARSIGYENVEICINKEHGFVKVHEQLYDVPFGRRYDMNGYSQFAFPVGDEYHRYFLARDIMTDKTYHYEINSDS